MYCDKRFLGVCLVIALSTRLAAAAPVGLGFDVVEISLLQGEGILVEIAVESVPEPGLAAFQLDLMFDPSIVHVLNPNEAFRGTIIPFAPLGDDPSICTAVRGTPTCADPAWFLTSTSRSPLGTDEIDNTLGRVQIAYGTSGAQAPPTGSGAIALIEVVAQTLGSTVVSFANVILGDNGEPPMEFQVGTMTMTVNVVPGSPTCDGLGGDADDDGICDEGGPEFCSGGATENCKDNCTLVVNSGQEDRGGIDTTAPDGIGDVCQCGDVDDTGVVDSDDVLALRSFLADPLGLPLTPEGISKCTVLGVPPACNILDLVVIRRDLVMLPPGIAHVCSAATGQ